MVTRSRHKNLRRFLAKLSVIFDNWYYFDFEEVSSMQLFRPTYEVEECLEAIRKVLLSGWTGTGPQCKQFEESWCHFTGAKHCHFLNSATAALHIAVRMLDLPKGSKILTTPLTFVSTNAVILYEGCVPEFVDINENDLSLDSNDFIKKANECHSKAALWVHYGGQVSPHFQTIMESSSDALKGLQMIEDCAHAGGAFYPNGLRVGSRTDTISCFSYQAVKNLPTFDSGMICCPSSSLLERAKRLAWLGIDKDTYTRTNTHQNDLYKWRYDVPELGWKYNGNDIAAAIANIQLKYLDRDNAFRQKIYQTYLKNFEGHSQVTVIPHSPQSAHHLVVVRVKNREEVIAALKNRGIAPGVHYLPNYEFPVFQPFYKKGSCPNLERISSEILSLPNHLQLTPSDIDQVCETVIHAAKH
jgi:dTDP-4-amino-4,6-dideoxygalactose transaminase